VNRVSLTSSSEAATQAIGSALAPLACAGDVLILSGDLGAGKTQFTKGLADGLGVVEPVTSPTFNILLVHEGRIPLYHFDLYRLGSSEQLDDLDYWGVLEADGVAVVEWGDRFPDAVPPECVSVSIGIVSDDERLLHIAGVGTRGEDLVRAWASACVDLPGVAVIVEEAL